MEDSDDDIDDRLADDDDDEDDSDEEELKLETLLKKNLDRKQSHESAGSGTKKLEPPQKKQNTGAPA